MQSIDQLADLFGIRVHFAPFYNTTGRPSVDSELMIRLPLIGYCMGIRSERRLCEEVHLNLAYRWFCRLDLTGAVLDHSTFSMNRHGRFRNNDLFRHLFESVVARCIAEGLVGGERLAADASLIAADANKQNSTPEAKWDSGAIDPEAAPRAVREYLAGLDDAAFGAASEVAPKFTSHSDPAAQWTGANKGPAFFAYATNYLIDTDHAVIVDVETTRAIRQAEVGAARTMVDRTMDRFELYLERLIADAAFGTAPVLGWLVEERGIEPHIPVFDKSKRTDGTFSREGFRYDHKADAYICPAGKELRPYRRAFKTPRSGVDEQGQMCYRASKDDCDACALKPRCSQTSPVERSCATSMKAPARWPKTSPKPRTARSRGNSGRRSRCRSRTSSAFSGWLAFDCEDRAAPPMKSTSPQPSKTSESSQS